MEREEFDSLLKESLNSETVPFALSARLEKRLRSKQNRHAKIIKFSRYGCSAAAIFICAITVLSNFNSKTSESLSSVPVVGRFSEKMQFRTFSGEETARFKKADETKPKKAPDSEIKPVFEEKQTEKEEKTITHEHNIEIEEKSFPQQNSPETAKIVSPHEESISTDIIAEESESSPENDLAVASLEDGFPIDEAPPAPSGMSRAGGLTTLSSLFGNTDDYKVIIYDRISQQIITSAVPYYTAAEGGLTQISGNEEFRISEDGHLIIIFQSGTIAPEEYGICEFDVGELSSFRQQAGPDSQIPE